MLEWDGKDGAASPVPLLKDMFGGERRKAKVLNFSIAYGKTAHGLSRDWNTSLEEAERTVAKWYDSRPEVRPPHALPPCFPLLVTHFVIAQFCLPHLHPALGVIMPRMHVHAQAYYWVTESCWNASSLSLSLSLSSFLACAQARARVCVCMCMCVCGCVCLPARAECAWSIDPWL